MSDEPDRYMLPRNGDVTKILCLAYVQIPPKVPLQVEVSWWGNGQRLPCTSTWLNCWGEILQKPCSSAQSSAGCKGIDHCSSAVLAPFSCVFVLAEVRRKFAFSSLRAFSYFSPTRLGVDVSSTQKDSLQGTNWAVFCPLYLELEVICL